MSGLVKNIAAMIAAHKLLISMIVLSAFYALTLINNMKWVALGVLIAMSLTAISGLFGEKIVAFFSKHWKKLVTVFVGHGIWSAVSWVYDNPLYMGVVAKFGPFVGGAIMTFGSLLICLGMLIYYRNKHVDWLGYDVAAKALADHINVQGKIFAILGDVIAFVILNICEDPFIATAYLRHGYKDGLRKRDLVVFFSSVLFSNCYWILRTVAIIEVVKYVWHLWF